MSPPAEPVPAPFPASAAASPSASPPPSASSSTSSSIGPAGPPGERAPLDGLRAVLFAGLLCGLLFGLADGVVAAWLGGAPEGPLELAGCLAAAVGVYALVACAGLGALALVGLALPRLGAPRVLLALGLGAGLFAELYWWSRPYVFYGRPSTSPERLAAAAGMLGVALGAGFLAAGLVLRLGPRARRGIVVATLAIAAGGAVFLARERAAGAERGLVHEGTADLPNVLLVVVDALRHDVLGCYGNERVETPVMDALAERGVLFERAFVQAPFTWTSFGSFLTGKYPRRHGLVLMQPGVRMRPNVTLPWHLKSAERLGADGTVVGRLADGDYLGATFMTGTLSRGSGLMRGFDVYFEALAGHDLVEADSVWSVFRSDLLLWVFKNKLGQRLDADLVVTTAADWLRENADRRFVAMVHLYSTHTPYDPPQRFRDLYLDPAYDGPIHAFYADSRIAIEQGLYEPTEADLRRITDLYHGGTTQADAQIGVVLDELDRQGVLDDTLVIVTSDHGESLGEPALGGGVPLLEHNHMVQTNLRIPLLMAWPKGLPAGRRVDALVDSIDVLPTVCDLLSLALPNDPDEGARGLVDGKSLLPLVRGEVTSLRRYSFAENGGYLAIQDLETKLVVPRAALPPEGWELAVTLRAEPPRFHDLAADPLELDNLLVPREGRLVPRERAADLERLLAALREWDAAMPIPLSDVVPSHRDREAAEILRGLGYTEGGLGWPAEDAPENAADDADAERRDGGPPRQEGAPGASGAGRAPAGSGAGGAGE